MTRTTRSIAKAQSREFRGRLGGRSAGSGFRAGPVGFFEIRIGRPQQDSNLRTRLRRPLLYPLSYGGWRTDARRIMRPAGPSQGYQPQRSEGHVLDLRA